MEIEWGEKTSTFNVAHELVKLGFTTALMFICESIYHKIHDQTQTSSSVCPLVSQYPLDSPYLHLGDIYIPNISSLQDIAGFMSSLRYRKDTKDSYQPVHVTIEKGYGDCEDLAIVAGSLMKSIGITPRFAFLYSPYNLEGHTVAYCVEDGFLWIFSNNETYVLEAENVDSLADIFNYPCVEVL